jgi:hypothetical protein
MAAGGGRVTGQELVLGRSALATVAGLKIGITVMKHDPADPAARLSIGEKGGTAHEIITVRAGDRFEFAGRKIEVTTVTPGYHPVGKVVLTVSPPFVPRPENLLLWLGRWSGPQQVSWPRWPCSRAAQAGSQRLLRRAARPLACSASTPGQPSRCR